MSSLFLILAYLGCVSSGAMLSMLLLLVTTYVSAAVWLISHGAVYSGLLYVLVYVGAIVVLIMFVVQLTNTSLTVNGENMDGKGPSVTIIQNVALVMSLSLLLTVASSTLGSDLLLNVVSPVGGESGIISPSDPTLFNLSDSISLSTSTLGLLASSIFNEYGYVLILSVHAIILAVIGPIKLALSNYLN